MIASQDSHRAKVQRFFETPDRYLHKRFGVRLRQELVAEWVGSLEYHHVLDLGCGDGSISIPLLQHAESLTLIDLSAAMLDLATAAIPEGKRDRVRRLHGGFESAGQLPARHDLVLAIGLLAHVPDPGAVFKTITAIMPVGGRLILQYSEASRPLTWLSLKLHRRGYQRSPVHWTVLRGQLEQHGFAVERVRWFGLQAPGFGWLPDAWLYRYEETVAHTGSLSWLGTDRLVLACRVNDAKSSL
jgi:cyclopropane fatty-acyl-phospholipid synthase-like methyltransferase